MDVRNAILGSYGGEDEGISLFSPGCGVVLMDDGCKRGNWKFALGDKEKFIACKDYAGIGPAGYAAKFWATATDGHAQVFRNPLSFPEKCRFVYFGGTFEIAFDVVGVADLNVISTEEKTYLDGLDANLGVDRPCQIFGQKDVSWIESITAEQFDQFILDVLDPALYRCLTECVPPINPPDKPWSYGYEKPSRKFEPLSIPLSGDAGFSFIADWLAGKILMPRSAVVESKLHRSSSSAQPFRPIS